MCVHQLGLDRPFHEQYFRYLGGLLQGDLGRSYLQKTEVATLIWSRLPATALLVAGAIFFEIAIGADHGPPRIAPARQPARPGPDGRVLRLCLDPAIRDGDPPSLHLRRSSRLVPDGRLRHARATGPAGADPRRPRRRLVFAADALQHDRRAAPGFHPHRQGQGAARRDRGRRPCAAECDPADRRA